MIGEKGLDVLRFIELFSPPHEPREWQLAYRRACDKWSAKAVEAKAEQLAAKGYIEYGVSPLYGWLTDKGKTELDEQKEAA